MEVLDQPQDIANQRPDAEHLGFAARVGAMASDRFEGIRQSVSTRVAILGASAVALVAGTSLGAMILDTGSAAAENAPTHPAPNFGPASLRTGPWAVEASQPIIDPTTGVEVSAQSCITAGLTLPTHLYGRMRHAGHEPYEKNPREVGVIQLTVAGGDYKTTMPDGCTNEFQALGRAEIDIKTDGKWLNMEGVDIWSVIHSRNEAGWGALSYLPSGHEKAWYYWTPGDQVRAKFDNVVKNLQTGQETTSKTKTIPVKVYR